MTFIRQKTSRGKSAFYLVENRREAGKVRQKVLAYLGPCDTLEGAIEHWEGEATRWHERALKFTTSAEDAKAALKITDSGEGVPKGYSRRGWLGKRCNRYWDCRNYADKFARRADQATRRVNLLRGFLV